MEWLNNYIYGKNLTEDELKYMFYYPLKSFAYKIADCKDYERVKGRLIILQKSLWKGACFKEVSYILDHTGLTKWQKFKLKFQYMFL